MQNEAVDLEELKQRLDGDRDLFLEVCEIFFADFVTHTEAIGLAIKGGNAAAINQHAHTVKGALANLSAKKAALAAFELEKAGKSNQLAEAPQLLSNLLNEVSQFQLFVNQIIEKGEW